MSDQRENAGASADQHITGRDEDGTFQTDRAPTAATPADGSSNAGINEHKANREGRDLQDDASEG
jgi:hypothetical protein